MMAMLTVEMTMMKTAITWVEKHDSASGRKSKKKQDRLGIVIITLLQEYLQR